MNSDHQAEVEKWDRIKDFVSREGSGPRQGSAEWLAARFWSIGGASIASYIGRNPHCDAYQEVMRRYPGKVAEIPSLAMMWGTLFEPLARAITEEKWKIRIIGHDMMIRYQRGCHYSPDGFSVLSLESEPPKIVLHEFKCVWSRSMGEMPDYYLPQVLMGMCVSPAEIGLFGQFVFRVVPLCRLSKQNMEVLPTIRSSRAVLDQPGGPTHCGFIRFITGPGVEIPIGSGADIGEMDKQVKRILHILLGLIAGGECRAEYSDLYPYTSVGQAQLARDRSAAVKERGEAPFLVWKMCLAEEFIVEKRPLFLTQVMRVIRPVITAYNHCRDLPMSPDRETIIRDSLDGLIARKKWMPVVEADTGAEDVEFI